ncbi:2-dehydropantoate 2-reductase [Paraburkholderia unamae]|uniref:ketopantoate reductase family protein n=1 Tax=Paraburkholderia unamae TaxID=219649 RepID=UPI001CAB78C7|nr:2-dehydropantoate 2-reductase [Paraburkholderia unamae]CAG9274430.1 2-dehydropantoate 2-reductase [Paraburkholderia unamae]
MKIAVFGAGAVGGYLAGRLIASGGHEISIVARGAHLAAIRANGLTIVSGTERYVAHPAAATHAPDALPEQDIVFVTLKAFAQSGAAESIARLRAASGWVVFVANGIPWWWRHGTGQPAALPLVDPLARLWSVVRPEHALGCVVYSANEIVAPGVIRHSGQNRWLFGEPDARLSGRLQTTAELLARAGLAAEACTDLRREIWTKVARNVPLNVVCALTRLPIDALRGVPGLPDLCLQLAREVAAIAHACGAEIADAPARIEAALASGGAPAGTPPWQGVKPSMLQDVLRGASLEVEAIVGQVRQLGEQAGVPCPAITTVLALLRGLAHAPRPEDADAPGLKSPG